MEVHFGVLLLILLVHHLIWHLIKAQHHVQIVLTMAPFDLLEGPKLMIQVLNFQQKMPAFRYSVGVREFYYLYTRNF